MARAKKGGLGRGLDSLIPIGIMEETEEVEREVADRKAARARAAKLASESKKASKSENEELIKEAHAPTSQTVNTEMPDLEAPIGIHVNASENASNIESANVLQTIETQKSTVKNSTVQNSTTQNSTKQISKIQADSAEVTGNRKTASPEIPSNNIVDSDIGSPKEAVGSHKESTVLPADAKTQGRQISGTALLKISEIEPNREQPRKDFNEDALQELAESIRLHGVIQPLIVQKKGEYYGIIAGERRWRAAKIAGLKEVPAIIREYTDREVMEISLIENIQREDLNAIEEAKAYQRLIQDFHLKQEEIAVKISKSRAAIANTMRLLKLDERVQNMLIEEEISSGHARALLPLEDGDLQYNAAQKIASESLSVRETEKMVKLLLTPSKEPEEPKVEPVRDDSFIYQALEEKMKSIMGTKVSIHKKDNNKGRIEIEYYSPEELERIVELFETIK